MAHKISSIPGKLKSVLFKECCVCGASLFGSYITDGYGNGACASHANEIKYCASCSKFCGKDLNSIGGGRFICSTCLNSIPDESSCKRIVTYVRTVLQGQGMIIPNFHLERVGAEKFTQFGHPSANGLALKVGNGYKIYVLKELINTALAETLAHEMTHTWQWERRIVVKEDICEGFCNLASYLVLKSIDTDMAKIKVRNLELNPDAVYGAGFRKVKEYYDMNGMQMTIQKMEKHK